MATCLQNGIPGARLRGQWKEEETIYYHKSPIQYSSATMLCIRYAALCRSAYQEQAKYHVILLHIASITVLPVYIRSYKLSSASPTTSACTFPYLSFLLLSSFLQVKVATLSETSGSREQPKRLNDIIFSTATITPITQNPVRQCHYLTWHRALDSLPVLPATPPCPTKYTSTCIHTHAHAHTHTHIATSTSNLSQSLQQAAL